MVKKDVSKDITKISPAQIVPEFMVDEEVLGLETLKQYIVPPFIKIVQKQASEDLLQYFSAGDVILSPINAIIAEMPRNNKGKPIEGSRTSFRIVPILFYAEWLTWNPIELKGTEMSIKYRTLDPNDPIVAKARSPQLRSEPHPTSPELKIRHVEHLNFVVLLYEHSLGLEPAILSFSRGEWKSGSKLAGLINMRHAPIYGCVFEAVVGHRANQMGDWFGFDVGNPEEDSPWVKQKEYPVFKVLHEEFANYHREQKLRAAYEVTPEQDVASVPGSEEF